MASLTHVCMWTKYGWKHVTAEDVAEIHPGGSVSASGELFMCTLCGESVNFVNGSKQQAHFRHKKENGDKSCPERITGFNYYIYTELQKTYLPIRMTNLSVESFSLEIGFIQFPQEYGDYDFTVEIMRCSRYCSGLQKLIYKKERFLKDRITYLPVLNIPCEQYRVNIISDSEKIRKYWPECIVGIDGHGTIFDKESLKMLVKDSDVVPNRPYYLLGLKKEIIYKFNGVKDLDYEEYGEYKPGHDGSTWCIYKVMAKKITKELADFFWQFHCRLTENPMKLQVLWPVYIKKPYWLVYYSDIIYLFIKGFEKKTAVFPEAGKQRYKIDDGKKGELLELRSNERQQLITAGNIGTVDYTYIRKEKINTLETLPMCKVTDFKDNEIDAGIYHSLPYKKKLKIQVPYDGIIRIHRHGDIEDECSLKAENEIVRDIYWGMDISVYVGLDCIWQASFLRKKNNSSCDEDEFLRKIRMYRGSNIKIDHAIGNVANGLYKYPKIRLWLKKCIVKGYINKNAYYAIKELVF